jgi:hypothetical protein
MQEYLGDLDEKLNTLDAYRQALEMIKDMGLDYDGYYSVDDLKGLVDDLVGFAKEGLRGNRPQYLNQGKVYEIIYDKWVEVPEERWSELVKEWKKLPGW